MKKSSVIAQLSPSLPSPPSLPLTPFFTTPSTPPSDITQSDIDLTNAAAQEIYRGWSNPIHSVKELATLFKVTVEFTKHRRKLLDMPYGKENSTTKRAIVYPVD